MNKQLSLVYLTRRAIQEKDHPMTRLTRIAFAALCLSSLLLRPGVLATGDSSAATGQAVALTGDVATSSAQDAPAAMTIAVLQVVERTADRQVAASDRVTAGR